MTNKEIGTIIVQEAVKLHELSERHPEDINMRTQFVEVMYIILKCELYGEYLKEAKCNDNG